MITVITNINIDHMPHKSHIVGGASPTPNDTLHTVRQVFKHCYMFLQILLSLASGCVFFTDAMEIMILSMLAPALECSSWKVSDGIGMNWKGSGTVLKRFEMPDIGC